MRVYNEDEARKHWGKAVIKPATVEAEGAAAQPMTARAPADLTVGKQLIIKRHRRLVLHPADGHRAWSPSRAADQYVREALTLERLEYAILVDQNGKKRYEGGPQVVFPEPTEAFIEARDEGQARSSARSSSPRSRASTSR